jgi:hypothetical protein
MDLGSKMSHDPITVPAEKAQEKDQENEGLIPGDNGRERGHRFLRVSFVPFSEIMTGFTIAGQKDTKAKATTA